MGAKNLTRIVRICGEINNETFSTFSAQLLSAEKVKRCSVTIELHSDGGYGYSALAFAARMRQSKCCITVVAYGYVASAAVLILASAHKRKMTKEAWVMVHEDAGKINGDVVKMEREAKQYRLLEQQWAKLLSIRTGTSQEIWERLHKETTYLNAQACLELGLIDEVV